jgi:hypothetical protein
MNNEHDEQGRPICPVCGRAIRPQESVARRDDAMIHVECWPSPRAPEA